MQTCDHCGAINYTDERWLWGRCDECAKNHHNHDRQMCMACHPEHAALIGVGSGIVGSREMFD